MTPNDIEVLLHCYTSPAPHPRIHAPKVQQALGMFTRQGIIEADHERNKSSIGGSNCFNVTEQGAVLIKMLCDTPFPIAHTEWTDPRNV